MSPTDFSAIAAVSSPDHNAERLAALKQLFPDLFTNEGRLNVDELKKVVDPKLVSETERYDFRWYGKTASKREAFTPSRAALVCDKARSVNPAKAGGNMIIEGENLEVLKLLSSSYRERIKCIYIDPPYNTGKDFVYSDRFAEGQKPYWAQTGVTEDGVKVDTNTDSDGRFHSNWLSMMHSRLLVARYLLKPDGVVFVSIADQEVQNLRRVMDDVFGEECFVAVIVIQSNKRGQTYKEIAKTHEYLVVYAKNSDVELSELEKAADSLPFTDSIGRYDLWELRNRNPKFGRFNRENLYFPIFVAPDLKDECGYARISLTKTGEFHLPVFPRNSEGIDGCWRWGKESGEKLALADLTGPLPIVVAKKRQDGEWNIYEKSRKATTKAKSIWDDTAVISEQGTLELGELGLGDVFDHPKPVQLVKRSLQIASKPGDLILDFFGGSGTTAQAVMELNKADGGNRQFILVQLPELTAADSPAHKAGFKKISDITIERAKRVIQKLEKEEKAKEPALFPEAKQEELLRVAEDPPVYGAKPKADGLGFKVFKLAKSHFPRVEFAPDPDQTEAENIELLKQYIRDKEATFHIQWERETVLDEVLLKNGFMLDYTLTPRPEFTKNEVFLAKDAHKESLICLDATLAPETVDHFKKHPEHFFICLELALDTTKKWNLKHHLGDKLKAF